MRIKYIKKPTLLHLFVPAIFILLASSSAFAYVKGRCDGCHTMHNSKDNLPVAQYAALDGTFTTDPIGTPGFAKLLKEDCVTCHTNSVDGAGSYDLNGFQVPAVNHTGPPTSVTAGGSFWYTSLGGGNRANGHNVRGISGIDGTISRAPGAGSIGCAGSCHDSLAFTDAATTPASGSGVQTNGCQGCHLKVGHHARASAQGGLLNGPGDAFRFLSGHDDAIVGIVPNGADDTLGTSYEDDDWGITPANFNIYKAQLANPEKHPYISIGRWCAGCHADFHAYGEVEELTGLSNGGDREFMDVANPSPLNMPWLRHPTNVYLPDAFVPGTGDFGWVAGGGVAYDPAVPFARGTTDRGAININDQVMCLSCHRAHASEFTDSLRFDYTAQNAHSVAAGDGETTLKGCFFCHRTKDDL